MSYKEMLNQIAENGDTLTYWKGFASIYIRDGKEVIQSVHGETLEEAFPKYQEVLSNANS